ncbi:MAG: tyrosine-type recombinase/integrase [Candidatus Methanoperedens sp.]|nr:tyrosine-type recombinase/integrase [Candidatus Methanoperedens sp.]
MKDDPFVIDFFNKIEASENTQKMYRQALKYYTNIASKTPEELILEAEGEIKAGKLMRERKLNEYLTAFKKFIEKQNFAPKSRNVFISGVKTFYKTYDIQLPSHVKTRKAQPLRENAANAFLRKETIVKMLNNAASLRDKSIILAMASSGMAMNEIRNLRISDFKDIDTYGIARLFLSRQKVADVVEPYYTFLSPEATEAIRNYLEERQRSEVTKIKSEEGYLFINYQNGEQLNERMFHYIFQQLGVKLGYITKTVRYGVNPLSSHKLRKFYSNTLKNEEVVDEGFVDYTMGHVTPAVQKAYHQLDPERLKAKYIKTLPYLTFLRTVKPLVVESDGYKKLREENEALQSQLREQDTRIGAKDSETAELRGRLDKLESALQSVISAAGKK